MKVSEFIFRYSKADDEGKKKLVVDNIKNAYVPYEVKVAHCQMIAEKTTLDGDKVKLNTPARYMLLVCVFILDHMDLAADKLDNVELFNKMEETGADDMICGILQKEFDVYRSVLDMCVDDLLDHERNYVDFVMSLLDNFSGEIADAAQKVEEENGNVRGNQSVG